MVLEGSVWFETAVKIVLQMIPDGLSVVEMKSKSFLTALEVKWLVLIYWEPDIGLSLDPELIFLMADRFLYSDPALISKNVGICLENMIMDEVFVDDIVGVVIKLTPDIKINLNWLGHVT